MRVSKRTLALAWGVIGTAAVALSGLAERAEAKVTPAYVWVVDKDGSSAEGTLALDSLTLTVDGAVRKIPLSSVRSVHSADPASASEAERIKVGLQAVQGKEFKSAEAAVADLTEIGLPVLSPLLAAYKDTDGHEPDPLYRLFGRIVPGHADATDRTLDLVRLAGGEALRGKLSPVALKLAGAGGRTTVVPAGRLRRLAVRQPLITRTFELHSLRHCTYVSWLDSGVSVTSASHLQADSAGYVRLSFDEDGWSSDPDGIETPLPGKRKLQEGFRWGVVLGRIGAGGERWAAGKHVQKQGLSAGRLYFAVNDNEHWQNNVGSYRVRLRVTEAYDLGDPQ